MKRSPKVFVTKWMAGHGAALPPLGILVGPDHTLTLLRHEYGHILQYERDGFFRFYLRVGLPSLVNMILWTVEKTVFGRVRWTPGHDSLAVEREANELSLQYFLLNPDPDEFRR